MENLARQLPEEATLWLRRVGGVSVVFLAFLMLAKVMRRIITKGADRLKLDKHLTSLLARTTSITLIVLGFVTALGTLGIKIGNSIF